MGFEHIAAGACKNAEPDRPIVQRLVTRRSLVMRWRGFGRGGGLVVQHI
jgi:hypothetical protein